MESITSPWGATFDRFVDSIRESTIIAAPYITSEPIQRLVSRLGTRRTSICVDVLTNLHSDNLIDGSLDAGSLVWLCEQVPATTVSHLRYLHAKAYVADDHTAIVTSANLTNGGLWRNHELGVTIADTEGVRNIAGDLREYGALGVRVSCDSLADLESMANEARTNKAAVDHSASGTAKKSYSAIRQCMDERLVELRTAGEEFASDPHGSITAQFSDAVLYVLGRHGPLPTNRLHLLVRDLKPELCDEEVDRVISGRTFGKRWKHDVRNAQQQLKRQGRIVLEHRKWRLT